MKEQTKQDLLLVFDEDSKHRILNSLGIKSNKQGNLIDQHKKILTDQNFEIIKINNFGGILKGSKIPINKESSELVDYFIKNR